jgi:hypothetical protein
MHFRVFLSLMLGYSTLAAQTRLSGVVIDSSTQAPLQHAAVMLLDFHDSTLLYSALSDARGAFHLAGVAYGRYRLRVSYLGYHPLEREVELRRGDTPPRLDDLALHPRDFLLNEATVREDRIPVTIKKDTIEFDAGAFQVRENAAVEDLLKKLPGVEVDNDGTIRAMGEQVTEVTVDGNPFFGADPKIATRNLPANVVDKVQVVDKKSEQAQFSGMDDGSVQKSINLTLKPDKKRGVFGNLEAGGGSQERYGLRGSANRFDGARQLSLLGGFNNLNEMGFSLQDAMNFGGMENMGNFMGGGGMGGGGMGGGGGQVVMRVMSNAARGGANTALPGNNAGITAAGSGGLNFREKWGKSLTANGSYFFNQADTENAQERRRQNLLPDGGALDYLETGDNDSRQHTHRLNLQLNYDIDSLHSLIFKPNLSFGRNENFNHFLYDTRTEDGLLINSGLRGVDALLNTVAANGELLFRKRFQREGRTFSAAITGRATRPRGEQFNESLNQVFTPNNPFADTINQYTRQDNATRQGGARLVYTEPIARNKRLELYYERNDTRQQSDRRTFDFNPASGQYDLLNDVFTNRFDNTFGVHEGGANIRFQKLRYDFTLGLRAQHSTIASASVGEETDFQRAFFNVFPQVLLNYNFSDRKRLRLQYRPDTRQPSLSQMQPAPDNSNPQFIQLGNPELKPEFAHRLNLNYNHFDLASLRSFFASAVFTATTNKIVNATEITPFGQQIVTPVNAQGAYSASAFTAWGLPIKPRRLNLNLTTQALYNRYANFINEEQNNTQTFTARQTARFSLSKDERYNLSLAANVAYNRAEYSLQPFLNVDFFNYGWGFDFSYTLPGGFHLRGDLDYSVNAGNSEVFDNRAWIVNGALAKDFLRGQKGTLELRALDLLNQNNSIFRNTGENFVEDVRNTALGRYVLLRFTYRFGTFGGPTLPGGPGMRIMRF